jgi:hypothetical protein
VFAELKTCKGLLHAGRINLHRIPLVPTLFLVWLCWLPNAMGALFEALVTRTEYVWRKEITADAKRSKPRETCGRWDPEGSVACGVAHQVYALKASSGGKLWESWMGGAVYSSPAVVGGTVFVGSNDYKVRGADPPGRLTTAGGRTCMRPEKL